MNKSKLEKELAEAHKQLQIAGKKVTIAGKKLLEYFEKNKERSTWLKPIRK